MKTNVENYDEIRKNYKNQNVKTIGCRLMEERRKKGWSQEMFSQELGVSRQMISKWELGTAIPRAEKIKKICDALQISPNDLFYGKKELDDKVIKTCIYCDAKLKKVSLCWLIIMLTVCIVYIVYFIYKCFALTYVSGILSLNDEITVIEYDQNGHKTYSKSPLKEIKLDKKLDKRTVYVYIPFIFINSLLIVYYS